MPGQRKKRKTRTTDDDPAEEARYVPYPCFCNLSLDEEDER